MIKFIILFFLSLSVYAENNKLENDYKNFEERGDKFNSLVNELLNES